MKRPYLTREWLIEDARDAVLSALDEFARASGLSNLPHGREGATDGDLPALFAVIDAHVDRLIERDGAVMPPLSYSESFIERTRRELADSQRMEG